MIKHSLADKVDRLIKDFATGGIKAYKMLIFCQHLGYVVEIICGMQVLNCICSVWAVGR
jgi:hypothetical protein